MIFEV